MQDFTEEEMWKVWQYRARPVAYEVVVNWVMTWILLKLILCWSFISPPPSPPTSFGFTKNSKSLSPIDVRSLI